MKVSIILAFFFLAFVALASAGATTKPPAGRSANGAKAAGKPASSAAAGKSVNGGGKPLPAAAKASGARAASRSVGGDAGTTPKPKGRK